MTTWATASAQRSARPHVSGRGVLLFIVGASFLLSAIKAARPNIGGLSVHPYVLLCVAALPATIAVWLRRRATLLAGLALLVAVLVSEAANGMLVEAVPSVVKWATVVVTFLVLSSLVRTASDLRIAAWGMIVGVAAIAIRGLYLHQSTSHYYVELMDGIGSRNVFSLWSLAPLAFAFSFLGAPGTSLRARIPLLVASLAIVVPQVLTLSRAGWILIALTGALVVASRRSIAALLTVAVAAGAVSVGIDAMQFEEKTASRLTDLEEGTVSDAKRGRIFVAALETYVENPVFGISQSELPREIGRRLHTVPHDTHNLVAEILGGLGTLGALAVGFCALLVLMTWRRARRLATDEERALIGITPILLILFFVRGLTGDAIIYNPAAVGGIALVHGLALAILERPRAQRLVGAYLVRRPAAPLAAGGLPTTTGGAGVPA